MRVRIIAAAAATAAAVALSAAPASAEQCYAIDGAQPPGEPPKVTLCVDTGPSGTLDPSAELQLCWGRLGCSTTQLI